MPVEAWVYPTALGGWRTALLKERTDGLASALYAHDDVPRPATYINIAGSDLEAFGTSALPLNAWTHLTATYDGATLRMYVNATLVGESVAGRGIVTSAGAFRIGGNKVWGEFFQGRIDEIRVYNRALGETEIQRDMGERVVQTTGPLNSMPVADAGPDQTIAVGDSVQLNGGSSTDVDGNTLSYQWSFVSRPYGSEAR